MKRYLFHLIIKEHYIEYEKDWKKVAVIEAGVIVNGIPVFKVDYQKEAGKLGDATLRSGLFSAIQSFAQDAFSDQMDELRLKNLTIAIKTVNVVDQPIALYAVADKETRSIDSVRDALQKVADRISAEEKELDTFEPARNDYLRDYFENEFRDLKMRPAERARRLFG
jgi:hypothetical protein